MTEGRDPARSGTTDEARAVEITRHLQADPPRVFEAWTDPDRMGR